MHVLGTWVTHMYCCYGNKPCNFKLCPKSTSHSFKEWWWENNGSSKLRPHSDWLENPLNLQKPLRVPERFSTYIITITSSKMLPSYLDAEWSLHASFITKEFGQRVTCVNASPSLTCLLLTVPFPFSVFCVFMGCLMSTRHICCPPWTPRTASVWRGPCLSFSLRVIIALWVTKNEGSGQSEKQNNL